MRKTVTIKDKGKTFDGVAYVYVVIRELGAKWTSNTQAFKDEIKSLMLIFKQNTCNVQCCTCLHSCLLQQSHEVITG
jgi:hypothetical protein